MNQDPTKNVQWHDFDGYSYAWIGEVRLQLKHSRSHRRWSGWFDSQVDQLRKGTGNMSSKELCKRELILLYRDDVKTESRSEEHVTCKVCRKVVPTSEAMIPQDADEDTLVCSQACADSWFDNFWDKWYDTLIPDT